MNTETQRRAAQTQRVIERLKQGPVLNTELKDIALRYGARIYDAREQGHDIVCERVRAGVTVYILRDKDAA